MAMDPRKATFSILHVPELIYKLRKEMAEFLRTEAGKEPNPEFALRLRAMAAQYEIGATGPDGSSVVRTP